MIVRCRSKLYWAENKPGGELAKYAEDLPEKCPPGDAEDVSIPTAYRLLKADLAGPGQFASHAALKLENRTKVDACRFASCSLMADYEKFLEHLPNMRKYHSHVAKLSIPEGIGAMKPKPSKGTVHFDFWCYSGQCLSNCVVEILALPPVDNANG